jgi:hypothetical protein
MSVMTRGIIQQHYRLAMCTENSRRQFHSHAQVLLAERDQLKAENEAMRKDCERLVFCTSHPWQQFFQGEYGWGVMDCADGLSIPFKDADSLRSAIDRVMSEESSHD